MAMSRLCAGYVGDVGAADTDRAFARRLEAGDHAQRGGLAAAGRAEQGEELALPDLHRNGVHRAHAAVIDLADAGDVDRCAHAAEDPVHASVDLVLASVVPLPVDLDQLRATFSGVVSSLASYRGIELDGLVGRRIPRRSRRASSAPARVSM